MHCLAVVQMCVFSYDRGVMESYSHVANLESERARPKEGKRYKEREREKVLFQGGWMTIFIYCCKRKESITTHTVAEKLSTNFSVDFPHKWRHIFKTDKALQH